MYSKMYSVLLLYGVGVVCAVFTGPTVRLNVSLAPASTYH
jgi:hypothetical protein